MESGKGFWSPECATKEKETMKKEITFIWQMTYTDCAYNTQDYIIQARVSALSKASTLKINAMWPCTVNSQSFQPISFPQLCHLKNIILWWPLVLFEIRSCFELVHDSTLFTCPKHNPGSVAMMSFGYYSKVWSPGHKLFRDNKMFMIMHFVWVRNF